MIQIGAHNYKIHFRDDLYDTFDHLGIVKHDINVILLDFTLSEEETLCTFVHESTHCISKRYGLNLDENQTSVIAEGMTQILLQLFPLEDLITAITRVSDSDN